MATALVVLLTKAEADSFQTEIAAAFDQALQVGPYQALSAKLRKTLAEIFNALKEQNTKIRLVLVTLMGFIEGTVGEDGFFGLEIQAQNAIKAKLMVMQAAQRRD